MHGRTRSERRLAQVVQSSTAHTTAETAGMMAPCTPPPELVVHQTAHRTAGAAAFPTGAALSAILPAREEALTEEAAAEFEEGTPTSGSSGGLARRRRGPGRAHADCGRTHGPPAWDHGRGGGIGRGWGDEWAQAGLEPAVRHVRSVSRAHREPVFEPRAKRTWPLWR